jgi:hypothetical protein
MLRAQAQELASGYHVVENHTRGLHDHHISGRLVDYPINVFTHDRMLTAESHHVSVVPKAFVSAGSATSFL